MGRRDGRRGEWCRAAEVRGQRPWDARRVRLRGSGAWGGVRRDAVADGRRELPQMPDEGAGKWAGRVPGGRVRDGSRWADRA